MGKGVRYSPEQKRAMKERALKLRARGTTQKDVAQELGIAVVTLRAILGKNAKRRTAGKAKRRPKKSPAGADRKNPVVQLATKRDRVKDIEKEMARLDKEKAELQKGMRALYKNLGKELFGGAAGSKK